MCNKRLALRFDTAKIIFLLQTEQPGNKLEQLELDHLFPVPQHHHIWAARPQTRTIRAGSFVSSSSTPLYLSSQAENSNDESWIICFQFLDTTIFEQPGQKLERLELDHLFPVPRHHHIWAGRPKTRTIRAGSFVSSSSTPPYLSSQAKNSND